MEKWDVTFQKLVKRFNGNPYWEILPDKLPRYHDRYLWCIFSWDDNDDKWVVYKHGAAPIGLWPDPLCPSGIQTPDGACEVLNAVWGMLYGEDVVGRPDRVYKFIVRGGDYPIIYSVSRDLSELVFETIGLHPAEWNGNRRHLLRYEDFSLIELRANTRYEECVKSCLGRRARLKEFFKFLRMACDNLLESGGYVEVMW